MIKLEHTVLPSPEQMQFVIEGMRNPMNSWSKSDSGYRCVHYCKELCNVECTGDDLCQQNREYKLGYNDHTLMLKLAKSGTDHRKYMRMMPVYVRITAPLYWWKEFDTYKIGTVSNSCSTMHKITEKEFVIDDFSCEHLDEDAYELLQETINILNKYGDIYNNGGIIEQTYSEQKVFMPKSKDIWYQMIQLIPTSYNQTRNIMLNYEVLSNIYKSRKNHKLNEWQDFCKWIETIPMHELIMETV